MSGNNYKQILDYINELSGSIIEIGTSKDHGSTNFFYDIAYQYHRFKFYTIDIAEAPYNFAEELSKNLFNMKSFNTSGENFLENIFPTFNEKICYAFLDNYDFNIYEGLEEPKWIKDQREWYTKNNFTYSNEQSMLVHLGQTKQIVKYADKKCIIQFDDTIFHNAEYKGKGSKAALFLIAEGWNKIPSNQGSLIFKNF